jgi:hypothetical protein
MLCECCNKKIVKKRTFKNLFEIETHHICEYCYSKFPIIPRVQVVPIEEGEILWYNLMKGYTQHPLAYMSFLKSYYVMYQKHYQDYLFMYFDHMHTELLNELDSLKLGNIFLVSLYENIDKKENSYEI